MGAATTTGTSVHAKEIYIFIARNFMSMRLNVIREYVPKQIVIRITANGTYLREAMTI